jgi:hypothetical protein
VSARYRHDVSHGDGRWGAGDEVLGSPAYSGGARACNTRVHAGATSQKNHLFRDAYDVKICFYTKKSVFNQCPVHPLHTCGSATAGI